MKVKQSKEGAESLLYNQLNHIDEDKNRMVSIGKLFFLAAILLIIIGGGRHLLMGQLGTGMNAVSEAGVGNGLAPESNAGDDVANTEVGGSTGMNAVSEAGVGNGLAPESNAGDDVANTEVGGTETSVGGKSSLTYVNGNAVGSVYSSIEYLIKTLGISFASLFNGDRDWCDCGKQGKLWVRPKNARDQLRSFSASSTEIGYAVFCHDVTEVEWRCDGMNQWQRAYFGNGQRVWPLRFTHENKNTCHRCWWSGWRLKCSNNQRSGRIQWFTPTARLDRTTINRLVGSFEIRNHVDVYYGNPDKSCIQTAEVSLADIANITKSDDLFVEKLMSNIVSDELEVAGYVGGEIGSSLREKAFDTLDTNGDGILDIKELKQINHRVAEAYGKLTDAQIDELKDNLSFPKFDEEFVGLTGEELEEACATLEHLKGIDLKQVFDEVVGTGPYRNLNLVGQMQDYFDDVLGATAVKKNEFDRYMEGRRYNADNYQNTVKMPQVCDGVDTTSAVNKRRKLFPWFETIFAASWSVLLGASIGAGIGSTIQGCIEQTSRCNFDNVLDVGGYWYQHGNEYNPFGRRNMVKMIQKEFVAKEE